MHTATKRPLTKRHLEVLDFLSTGATTKEIAKRMKLSPGTVRSHLGTIYHRMNVSNRTEAVAKLLRSDRFAGATPLTARTKSA